MRPCHLVAEHRGGIDTGIDTGHRRCANVVTVTSDASPTPATAGSDPTGLTAALAAIVGEALVVVAAELRSATESN
jgi:hypothetical protein